MRHQPRCGRLAVGPGFLAGETGVESAHDGLEEEGRSRSSVVVERIGRMWSEGVLAIARNSGEGVFVVARMFGEVVAHGNSGVVWRIGCSCGYYN